MQQDSGSDAMTSLRVTLWLGVVACVGVIVAAAALAHGLLKIGGMIFGAAATVITAWLLIRTFLIGQRRRVAATGTTEQNQLADQFAEVVENQWTREANRRGLLVPEPIPVKWRRPSLPLAGSAEAAASSRRFKPLPGLPTIAQTKLMEGQISDLYAIYGGLGSGRLVIAGAAGSGKSGTAVLLILTSLEHRKQASEAKRPQIPVPLLFTTRGWDPNRQPIQDWLMRRIQETYPLFAGEAGALNATALIAAGKVSVLLDGLDEMAVELRPTALQALSQQTVFRVVVLTRTAEMASAVSEQGVLEGATAIELQNIDSTTAADYLTRVQLDPPPDGWRQLTDYIRKMPESSLAQALNKPLTLTLVRDTYPRGDDPRELLDFCDSAQSGTSSIHLTEDIVDHLLNRVLSAAYKPRPGEERLAYDLRTAQRAFTNIARQMNRNHTRDLALWSLERWTSDVPRGMIEGLIIGIGSGVTAGVIAWLMAGIRAGFVIGIVSGFIFGVINSVVLSSHKIRSFVTGAYWRKKRILMEEEIRRGRNRRGRIRRGRIRRIIANWEYYLFSATAEFLVVVIVAQVAFGAVFGPASGLRHALVLGISLAGISILGLIYGLVINAWQKGQNSGRSLDPLTSWRRDQRTILTAGLSFGFTEAIVVGIVAGIAFGLKRGLTAGIIVGIVQAGTSGLSLAARSLTLVQLARSWHTPVRLMRFLDDARERSVLRTVGSLYQFRHARLQDLLAKENPTRLDA